MSGRYFIGGINYGADRYSICTQKPIFPMTKKGKKHEYAPGKAGLYPMANIYVDQNSNKAVVERDMSDIHLDYQRGTNDSYQAGQRAISTSRLHGSAKDEAHEMLSESERIGRLFVEYLGSPESKVLTSYLARKGGYSEGIDKLLVQNFNPATEDGKEVHAIAATAPKIGVPSFLLYNPKQAQAYKNMIRRAAGSIDGKMLDYDILAHELTHSYLHSQSTDKLQGELDVERTLIFVNSRLASQARNSYQKNQYNTLVAEHIRRYMLQRQEQAILTGKKFDPEAEMQELYSEYVAEFGDDRGHPSAHDASHADADEGSHEAHNLEAIVEESGEEQTE